jgi:hypothetical protein
MENKSSLTTRPTKQNKKKEKKRTALSIMLVSVCLWFVLLKTPASVYINFPEWMEKPEFQLVYSIVMLINYTNHAVNLILYIVISSQFRKEFKEFFISIIDKIPFLKKRHQPIVNKKNTIIKGVNFAKISSKKVKSSPEEVAV